MTLFGSMTPMVLYHQTQKDRLAKIRREGLKPRVPGQVWGVDDPITTKGKAVVWLTADPTTWHHAQHHDKAKRGRGVLLTVIVNWRDPKLRHYISWRDPRKKRTFCENPNHPVAWFVYFGRIPPAAIVFPRLRRRKVRRK